MNIDPKLKLVEAINEAAIPLEKPTDYALLLKHIGDARFVMIGEASHGTEEFYQTRIEITQQLIQKHGFMAIAIEADWPDAYRVHQYLQGKNVDDSKTALDSFKRFPTWMWRNTIMPPFLKWLREYNDSANTVNKVGFYGLDLYSMNTSMQAVINYLTKVDPTAAEQAKQRYACFDHLNVDPQMYGYLINKKIKKACINEVAETLYELQLNASKFIYDKSKTAEDDYFCAVQNARLVKNAETYYRSMFEGQISSWNLRDRHMMETLNVITDYLEHRFNKPAKIIIWAHNSHLGDARATEMGARGEVNIGQLIREQHSESYSIGFSTYDGFVTAASNWDEPAERKKIVPGLPGSYEELFHFMRYKNFILNLSGNAQLAHFFKPSRLQRAIGVIYRPETERLSHYFFTRLFHQFDSIIHFDRTHSLQPLDANAMPS